MFLSELVRQSADDHISFSAAAIAYYAWLSLFPLLLLSVGAFGIWVGQEEARHQLMVLLAQNLPVLQSSGINIEEALLAISRSRSTVGIIGAIGLAWAGTQVVLAAEAAYNNALGVKIRRKWFVSRLRALAFLGAAGIMWIVSIGTSLVAKLLLKGFLGVIVGWMLPIILLSLMFCFALMYLPNKRVQLISAAIGGVVSAVLWTLANSALIFYFSRLNRMGWVYGPFSGVVIALLAVYYLAFVTLLGVETCRILMSSNEKSSSERR